MNERPLILIVDDEQVNIKVLEKALKEKYEIISVNNGFDAIEKIKETRPDMVILDVMMPDVSGFDVCMIIKEDIEYADIPILFLTAVDTVDAQILGLKLGGIDFLAKPVNLDMLKFRIRNHIELKRRNDLVREQRDQLEAALSRIKQLEGIIPICSYCKKIRDDENIWLKLETYISQHSVAEFSHGICPDCFEEQMKIVKELKFTSERDGKF